MEFEPRKRYVSITRLLCFRIILTSAFLVVCPVLLRCHEYLVRAHGRNMTIPDRHTTPKLPASPEGRGEYDTSLISRFIPDIMVSGRKDRARNQCRTGVVRRARHKKMSWLRRCFFPWVQSLPHSSKLMRPISRHIEFTKPKKWMTAAVARNVLLPSLAGVGANKAIRNCRTELTDCSQEKGVLRMTFARDIFKFGDADCRAICKET